MSAYDAALKIYHHYYDLAFKDFGNQEIANMLAKIPADYVFNNYTNDCKVCCLDYCNDLLDSEFEKLNPVTKREIYEKTNRLSAGNISEFEINNNLKRGRRNFKDLYLNQVQRLKSERENDLSRTMNRMVVDPDNILTLKNLNLK
jgi:hypothetical protein